MTKKEYETKRNTLLSDAQAAIDAGDIEKANTISDSIDELDAQFEKQAKAQANLEAKKGAALSIPALVTSEDVVQIGGTTDKADAKSSVYRTAWAKHLRSEKLSESEASAFETVNAVSYTHTTKNTPVVVPDETVNNILETAKGMYPYFGHLKPTTVKGALTQIVEKSSSEAKWYEEDEETDDGEEKLDEISLKGCELARNITISWKLRSMAIPEFLAYVERKLAEKVGAALGYGATHGKGTPASQSNQKAEPTGTVTALLNEEGTPQVVKYTPGALEYVHVTDLFSRIRAVYLPGAGLYANNKTVYKEIANVLDDMGRPIFVPSAVDGGVGKVLGVTVYPDDSMLDGEILLSDPVQGRMDNINESMSILVDEEVRKRRSIFAAYMIFDGTTTFSAAHALLQYGEDVASTGENTSGNESGTDNGSGTDA